MYLLLFISDDDQRLNILKIILTFNPMMNKQKQQQCQILLFYSFN